MQAPQTAVLLRIYTEEGRSYQHQPLAQAIVYKARELGIAGATMLVGPVGFGKTRRIHSTWNVDAAWKLPVVIEIVDAEEKVRSLLEAMDSMKDVGLITLEKVEVVHYGSAVSS